MSQGLVRVALDYNRSSPLGPSGVRDRMQNTIAFPTTREVALGGLRRGGESVNS